MIHLVMYMLHGEKLNERVTMECIRSQPQLKTKLESALLAWKERNTDSLERIEKEINQEIESQTTSQAEHELEVAKQEENFEKYISELLVDYRSKDPKACNNHLSRMVDVSEDLSVYMDESE